MKMTKKSGKVKKIIKITALSLAGLILVTVIAAGIVLYGRIATVMSVKKIGEQLYTVNHKQDYHLDKALSSEIQNEDDLMAFICDDMFFGYQVDLDTSNFACSAFITDSEDGNKLVGRNFDYDDTETLAVYTHPSGSYASIGSADLDFIHVGAPHSVSPMSMEGKIPMLAAPYLCMDGVNEKGLSVAILDLSSEETHMDTGKPDLLITIAVRLLLDRAADVNEAVSLLEKYDIHTGHGWTQHLFVADASGKASVVEWHKGKMKVVDSPICTNFRLSSKTALEDPSGMCDRFDTIKEWLDKKPENDADGAMELLNDVSVSWTQWSCVFHLNDFSVDYVTDNDYNTVYHLTEKDF